MLDHLDQVVGWYSPVIEEEVLSDSEYFVFREPDLDDEITGIAIKPGCTPSWIKSLPLLWKGVNNND